MQLPIKTLITPSTQTTKRFLARSGICFNRDRHNVCVYGFGLDEDKEKATRSSQFEALERLYATQSFHKNDTTFLGYLLQSPNTYRVFHASEILIGSGLGNKRNRVDANGLGCHHNLQQAIQHALFELIERHLLSEIWYGGATLSEIREHTIIHNEPLDLRFYSLSAFDIPFVIAILSDLDKGIWVLGSALRATFSDAMMHAMNEACMLLESSFIGGVAYSHDIEARLSSLKNKEYSQKRHVFLQKKVVTCDTTISFLQKIYSLDEIIEKTLHNHLIWVVKILENTSWISVVRVICTAAQNPRWLRDSRLKYHLFDPFC